MAELGMRGIQFFPSTNMITLLLTWPFTVSSFPLFLIIFNSSHVYLSETKCLIQLFV